MNHWRYLTASFTCFVLSLAAFLVARRLLPTDAQCAAHLWPYSPAFEAVTHRWMNLADYYFPRSPLRGNELERPGLGQRWRDYTYDGIVSVPYHRLAELGVDPDDHERLWQVNPIEGGGVAAVLSVHYQMNCLNLIRKYIHRNAGYDYAGEDPLFNASATPPHRLRSQVEQCIEELRQELTCHVDQSLYLVWPDPSQPVAWNEDNAVRHKCRDYGAVTDWARRHAVRDLHASHDNLYYPVIGRLE